jgi:predicted DNA-binding protein (MmcQ/YjbR family)
MGKQGAYKDCPFGPFPICFKVGSRIFLEWYPSDDKITVRCEPMLADYYRQTYPQAVTVGYHCPDRQKPYKNTVSLGRGLEDSLIYEMIDTSYHEAWMRLKRNEKCFKVQ